MKTNQHIVEDGVIAGNIYDKYGSGNLIAKYLMREFNRAILDLVIISKATDIHEVGCGEGYLACWLAENKVNRVRASDFSHQIIDRAKIIASRANLEISFKAQSIYNLNPIDDSAELIVCCEVLEHLAHPEKAIKTIVQLAKPFLLVSVPHEPLWSMMNMARGKYLNSWGNTPGHIQRWSRKKFVSLLSKHVDVIAIRTPIPWTVVLCQARKNRIGQEDSQ